MLPKLICMCGLQGSGKSYKAKQLKEQLEKEDSNKRTIIVSSDQIRKDYLDISHDNTKVFNKVYADMNYWLRQGDNVILDCTNLTNKSRRQIFNNLQVDCYKICHIMNTPYGICVERVKQRNQDPNEHYVPEDILERYIQSFEIPFYAEGWDVIELDNIIDFETSFENKQSLLQACDGFDQKNKHHTQDLGQHMIYVGRTLAAKTENQMLIEAGYYHDIGKLFTQTIGDDGNCHYYNHDSVGTYNLMCNCAIYNIIDNSYEPYSTIAWLTYINYHMKLHQVKTEKAIRKWKNILGESLYENLRLFEEVDKSRPDIV